MAEEYMIERGINPQVDKQLDDYIKKVSKLADLLDKVNMSDINPKNGQNTTPYANMAKGLADVDTSQKKIIEMIKKHELEIQKIKEQSTLRQSDLEKKYQQAILLEREKSQNRLIELEIKKEEAINASNKRAEENAIKSIQKEEERTNKRIAKELENISKIEQARRRADAISAFSLTPQQKVSNSVDSQFQNNIIKLNAIATSEYSTQLQKLYALQEIANRKAQAEFVPGLKQQSQAFIDSAKESANYSKQILQLEQATGKIGSKTQSAYGSMFSFTQIMRELPNFAQSTRIGFMSLSNNIPMFVDDLKRVASEVDINTGKSKGWGFALGQVGKSLLSFNTIVIIATTLMVMFGDDIMKAIGNMLKGKEATDNFSLSVKTLIATTKDYSGQAHSTIENVMKLGAQIDKYGNDVTKTDSLVKEFNNTFHTHANTIEQVRALYPKMAKDLIDAAIKMQAAMSLISKGANAELRNYGANKYLDQFDNKSVYETEKNINIVFKAYERGLKEAGFTEKQIVEEKNSIFSRIRDGKSYNTFFKQDVFEKMRNVGVIRNVNGTNINAIMEITKEEENAFEYLKKSNSRLIASAIMDKKASKIILDETNKAVSELIQFMPKQDEPAKYSASKVVQTGREMLIALKAYNAERTKLMIENKNLEDKITDENLQGIKNSFYERGEASKLYYNNQKRILELEENDERFNLDEKYKKQFNELIETQSHNKKLYDEQKISNERFDELTKQFIEGQETLSKNKSAELLELQDKYQEKSKESQIKYLKDSLKIDNDYYDEKIKAINYTVNREVETNKIMTDKALFENGKMSNTEIALSVIGFSKNTSVSDAMTRKDSIEKENQYLLSGIKRKLEITREGSEQYIKLKEEEIDQERKINDDRAKSDLEIEKAVYEEQKEIKTEIAKKSIDILKELWSAYWAWEIKKIEQQQKKISKVENNKIKDVEDREKSGVITKEEAEAEKQRITVYYQSLQDELDKKKAEKEKQQFLFNQGLALGQVWINYAVNASKEGINPITQALLLGLAIAETGLIAAQTIPQFFAEGGTVTKDTLSVLGDGGKKEVAILPNNKYFISPDVPTMYNLPKGTEILPDAVQWEKNMLQRHLILSQTKGSQFDERMYNEIKDLKIIMKNKKMISNSYIKEASIIKRMNQAQYQLKWKKGV